MYNFSLKVHPSLLSAKSERTSKGNYNVQKCANDMNSVSSKIDMHYSSLSAHWGLLKWTHKTKTIERNGLCTKLPNCDVQAIYYFFDNLSLPKFVKSIAKSKIVEHLTIQFYIKIKLSNSKYCITRFASKCALYEQFSQQFFYYLYKSIVL